MTNDANVVKGRDIVVIKYSGIQFSLDTHLTASGRNVIKGKEWFLTPNKIVIHTGYTMYPDNYDRIEIHDYGLGKYITFLLHDLINHNGYNGYYEYVGR